MMITTSLSADVHMLMFDDSIFMKTCILSISPK